MKCFYLGLALCPFTIFILVFGIREGIRVDTYVQTNCLVENSWLENCSRRFAEYIHTERCVQPKWLIKFIHYAKIEHTTVLDRMHYISQYDDQTENQTYGLEKYRVEIFKCR